MLRGSGLDAVKKCVGMFDNMHAITPAPTGMSWFGPVVQTMASFACYTCTKDLAAEEAAALNICLPLLCCLQAVCCTGADPMQLNPTYQAQAPFIPGPAQGAHSFLLRTHPGSKQELCQGAMPSACLAGKQYRNTHACSMWTTAAHT
jgi:hypothetical protein